MGGFGSGMWNRFDKKNTVEESLTLRMARFRDQLEVASEGWICRESRSGRRSSIQFDILPDEHSPTITNSYRWRDSEQVRIPIRLQSTPLHFGGRSSWFTCPPMAYSKPCKRRVATLHLAPGSKYFGCRLCHRLTYYSSQTAHQFERMLVQMERW